MVVEFTTKNYLPPKNILIIKKKKIFEQDFDFLAGMLRKMLTFWKGHKI
jgi:hypothetical protein